MKYHQTMTALRHGTGARRADWGTGIVVVLQNNDFVLMHSDGKIVPFEIESSEGVSVGDEAAEDWEVVLAGLHHVNAGCVMLCGQEVRSPHIACNTADFWANTPRCKLCEQLAAK